MAVRGANGRFVREIKNDVPQNIINLDTAIANLAQAAMNADTETAKRYWTNKLWALRNLHKYKTTISTFVPASTVNRDPNSLYASRLEKEYGE